VKKRPRTALFYVYVVSLLLHAGFALSAILLPRPKRTATVAIQLAQAKKKKEPPKPPPPTPEKAEEKPKPKPPPPQPQQQQAKVAPEAKTEAPPPTAGGNEGFVETGLALGNAEGPGIAVPTAVAAAGPTAPTATATATHKVQQLTAPAQGANVCNDPPVKPKRKSLVTPKYTLEARQADIEGIIRVEVTVDESGHVANARILSGLGYGLDQAALAAAKQCTFEPATQCGKPIVGTAVLPFRMQLE
jgi:protein TonB